MAQTVLTGNRYLKGQSYLTIASEIVVEIKKGATWEDEEFFIEGDFRGWDIDFFVAKQFGLFVPALDGDGEPVLDGDGNPVLTEDRMAIGQTQGLQFGDFTIPVLDDNGDPVLDDNGDPVVEELAGYTRFQIIIDSDTTSEMEVSPIAFKEIATPRAGRDYWLGDLEASRTVSGRLEVKSLYLDLVPVVVRGEV
jgi:hypothetical protein